MNEFESIRPYNDEEAVEALRRVARHPALPVISKYLFPREAPGTLAQMLSSVDGVDAFQDRVMIWVINALIAKTAEGFSFSGLKGIKETEGCLFVSNHRDIVLDPALIQYALHESGLPYSDICVGSNLLTSQLIEDLMRSNRMIKVIRGIPARQMYLSSQVLSKYIRESVTAGHRSVWIAQREGRTKDGLDKTEQGLLKMFDMSGEGSFEDNFSALHIVPVSISYEYEPCDIKKAREVYLKRRGPYTKKRDEDLHSILTGIRQPKGHICITFDKPLTEDEIRCAASCTGNDRYQRIRQILDSRIAGGYKLWKTNYMACDMMTGSCKYLGIEYLPADLKSFETYITHKLNSVERSIDRAELRDILLHIYGNPVLAAASGALDSWE